MNDEDWTRGGDAVRAQRCPNGHAWYLPRQRCPRCSAAVEWFVPSGRGTVFAVTTVHRRTDGVSGPIGIALVDLDEGVRVMSQCPPGTGIGSRVQVAARADAETGKVAPFCEVAA